MKTKEELNELKEEVETLIKKLAELNQEELTQVCGGDEPPAFIELGSEPPGVSLTTSNIDWSGLG